MVACGVMATIGCSYGHPPPRIVAGRQASVGEVRALRLGETATHIRELLGAPLSVTDDSGGETWIYRLQTHQQEHIKLFGLIPWPAKERRGELSATFRFKNEVLTEKLVGS